jgi:hypothetical protein
LVHWVVSLFFYLLWWSTVEVTGPREGGDVKGVPETAIMVLALVIWIHVTELLSV